MVHASAPIIPANSLFLLVPFATIKRLLHWLVVLYSHKTYIENKCAVADLVRCSTWLEIEAYTQRVVITIVQPCGERELHFISVLPSSTIVMLLCCVQFFERIYDSLASSKSFERFTNCLKGNYVLKVFFLEKWENCEAFAVKNYTSGRLKWLETQYKND